MLSKRRLRENSPPEITQSRAVLSIGLIFFTTLIFAQNSDDFVMPGLFGMPETDVQIIPKNKIGKDAVRVDLHRFMGFEELPARYLSLPYDTLQRTNVEGAMPGISFLLLLLLPILFLFPRKFTAQTPLTNFSMMILCGLMLIISIPSAFLNKNNFASIADAQTFLKNNPSPGILGKVSDATNSMALEIYRPIQSWFASVSGVSDSITYPILIGLFLTLIYLLFRRTEGFSKVNQIFVFFLSVYFFLWWILGAGGSWYGMLLFCLPFIFLIKGMALPEGGFDFKNPAALSGKSGILMLACGIWMFLAFTYRAANYYPINEQRTKHIYIPPFVEYQTGIFSKDRLINATFPNAVQLGKVINQTDGLVYRVGTQLNFFIENNDRRVYADTFLDFFESMVRNFKDKNKIIHALKARGFDYIIFDLNLAMNDQTPEKAMTRKFTNFMNTLYDNPRVELTLTDRTIRMNDSGQVVSGVFPTYGSIERPGRIAVFRLK